MAGRRRGEHIVPHEVFNHQIHLVWSFKLVQVAGTYRLAVDDFRQPLRHEMRRIPRRRGAEMERWHCTTSRDGQSIKPEDAPQRAGSNVAWRPHHSTQHFFNKHRIGRREE